MADLTSTLTITGTANGKAISITHTFTLEDVYDAGAVDEEGTGAEYFVDQLLFNQNNPNYLMFANRDAAGVTAINLTGSGGSELNFVLPPGALACLTAAEGTGLFLDTTTATGITLERLANMVSNPVTGATGALLPSGRINALMAFQATT